MEENNKNKNTEAVQQCQQGQRIRYKFNLTFQLTGSLIVYG